LKILKKLINQYSAYNKTQSCSASGNNFKKILAWPQYTYTGISMHNKKITITTAVGAEHP